MTSLTPRLDRLERNLIINGNFDFWQRGTSFASVANGAYGADRFSIQKSGTMVGTVSQSTSVPTVAQSSFTSRYSWLYTVTTAQASLGSSEGFRIRYHVEGQDYAAIAGGRNIRLQFWARSSKIGQYSIVFMNNAGDRYYATTYTITLANTWEKKTIDLTTDAAGTWLLDSGRGLTIIWSLGEGSSGLTSSSNSWQSGLANGVTGQVNVNDTIGATFQLAQVMLIPGDFSGTDVEIPFQRCGRTVQDELAMCQRYCERLERKTGQQNIIGMAYIINSAVFIAHCTYKVPKRINTVTMSQSALSNQFTLTYNATSQAFNSLALFNETDEFGARVGNSGMAGLTPVSGVGALAFNADGAYIVFEAEL